MSMNPLGIVLLRHNLTIFLNGRCCQLFGLRDDPSAQMERVYLSERKQLIKRTELPFGTGPQNNRVPLKFFCDMLREWRRIWPYLGSWAPALPMRTEPRSALAVRW